MSLSLFFAVSLFSLLFGVQLMALTTSASTLNSRSGCLADLNKDGIVDIMDLSIVARALGTYPGHQKWNPEADLNNDYVVDILDITLLAKDYGMRCLCYDFDEPMDWNVWNVVSGNWSVLNGSLEGLSSAEGLIYSRDVIWKECTLTARVKITGDSQTAEAAFCFCFVDTGNFYWAGLGCWGHRVSVSRMVAHVPEEMVFSGDSAEIVKDFWYIVTIKISGDTIMVYVDNVLELTIKDPIFTNGMIGVRPWDSHIIVDYITVSGFVSTPIFDELEVYRGFACGGDDFIYERYTTEHFKKVRQLGFDCLLVEIWWSNFIESDKDAVGVYNEQNLQGLRRSVDLALSQGFNVILSGRVCYNPIEMPDWAGWATHDYVNLQDEGLDRYAKFWEMMVQRFPDCMYCLWHMPYHMQGVDSYRTDRYYTVTFPTLLSAVRKHSNNNVIFVPIHQGSGSGRDSYYYETATPFSDKNIIYGCGHMTDQKVEYGSNWDYNYQKLEDAFKGIKRFKETYNLPMMSVEYFPLQWERGKPISQSRLDCLAESLKRMDKYGIGWMYWRLSHQQRGGDNILEDLENFEPNLSILTILQTWK